MKGSRVMGDERSIGWKKDGNTMRGRNRGKV